MRTLYFRPGLVRRMEPECSLVYVTPLLRELIIETVRLRRLRLRNAIECALRDLLGAQIVNATAAPMDLTMPSEPRALTLAQLIFRNPADSRSIAKLCVDAGIGVRTAQRLFRRELGVDIETWRRQVRLTRAVQLLIAGQSVKEVSFKIGYRQPGAFVEAFRRLFGSTPKLWVAGLRDLRSVQQSSD